MVDEREERMMSTAARRKHWHENSRLQIDSTVPALVEHALDHFLVSMPF
jgi:hypothetical protein